MDASARPAGRWPLDRDFLQWVVLLALVVVLALVITGDSVGFVVYWVALAVLVVFFLAMGIYTSVRGRFTEVARAVGVAGIADGDDVVTIGSDDGLAAVTTALEVPGARVRAVVSRHAPGFWTGAARERNPQAAVAATQANVDAAGVGEQVTVEAGDLGALDLPDASVAAVLSYRLDAASGGGKRRKAALAEMVRITTPGGRITLVINQNTTATGSWGWRRVLQAAGVEGVTSSAHGVNRFGGLRIMTGTRSR